MDSITCVSKVRYSSALCPLLFRNWARVSPVFRRNSSSPSTRRLSSARAAMYPREVFPHALIPMRTIDAFGAKVLDVLIEEVRNGLGSGVLVPLEFDTASGLLGPVRDMGRSGQFLTSISLSAVAIALKRRGSRVRCKRL